MGKAAKFKKIRRLASQMPVININVIKTERLQGSGLPDSVKEDGEGKPIDPKIVYKHKKIVQQPLNHNRKMKMMYNKYGLKGVNSYLQAVKNHVNKANAI